MLTENIQANVTPGKEERCGKKQLGFDKYMFYRSVLACYNLSTMEILKPPLKESGRKNLLTFSNLKTNNGLIMSYINQLYHDFLYFLSVANLAQR